MSGIIAQADETTEIGQSLHVDSCREQSDVRIRKITTLVATGNGLMEERAKPTEVEPHGNLKNQTQGDWNKFGYSGCTQNIIS